MVVKWWACCVGSEPTECKSLLASSYRILLLPGAIGLQRFVPTTGMRGYQWYFGHTRSHPISLQSTHPDAWSMIMIKRWWFQWSFLYRDTLWSPSSSLYHLSLVYQLKPFMLRILQTFSVLALYGAVLTLTTSLIQLIRPESTTSGVILKTTTSFMEAIGVVISLDASSLHLVFSAEKIRDYTIQLLHYSLDWATKPHYSCLPYYFIIHIYQNNPKDSRLHTFFPSDRWDDVCSWPMWPAPPEHVPSIILLVRLRNCSIGL